jgi:hypothetical protein
MVKLELLKFATSSGKTSVVRNADFVLEWEHSNEVVSQQDCVNLHTYTVFPDLLDLNFPWKCIGRFDLPLGHHSSSSSSLNKGRCLRFIIVQ